jgi:UDP-glucuronate 4-epimerase
MARILVTGAAGFIGARVAEMLLARGEQVVGIDNLNPAYDPRLKNWRLERLKLDPGFHFLAADITDRSALEAAADLGPFSAAINLAARAGVRPSVNDPWVYLRTNAEGALNMLDFCVRHAIGKFVLASTSSLYGAAGPRPFKEDAEITRPLSPYAASKGAAEMLAHSFHSLHGLDITILRYFTVYGPAGRPDMSIFRFVQWISESRPLLLYGDGNQERDFTYIDDIAAGTLSAMQPLGFEIINLGGDHPYSLLRVIQQLEAIIGRPARIEHHRPAVADVPGTWANIEKAGRLLAWEPVTSLEQGLRSCVEWYQSERQWAADIHTLD